MAMSTFRSYASPPPHLFKFFPLLRLVNVPGNPLITPIGSVSSANFLPEIPLSAAATFIIPGEVIPNYKRRSFIQC